MAIGDDPQRGERAPIRVYKASDVHKRRVDSKSRPEARKAPGRIKRVEPQEPARPVSAPRTQFLEAATAPIREAVQEEPPAEDAPQQAGEATREVAQQEGETAREEGECAPKPRRRTQSADERRETRHTRRGLRIGLAIGGVVCAIALVLGGVFAWNRWLRYDDAADFQGVWYVVGTTVPVSIDAESIHLTEDVTYAYSIDADDKAISYTFGPMQGQGRYWFSGDRRYLVVTDGDEFSGAGTVAEDLVKSFEDFIATSSGASIRLPEGDGIIAFSREPDPAVLAAEEAAAKAAEEADGEDADDEDFDDEVPEEEDVVAEGIDGEEAEDSEESLEAEGEEA